MVRWSQVASAAMILLLVVAVSQAQSAAKMPAADLVKAVISKELNSSAAPDVRWKYVLYKDADGKQETREVVQTKSGSIDRLLAVGGKPLSSTQEREEADRIVKLSHHPDEQRKMEQAHRKVHCFPADDSPDLPF